MTEALETMLFTAFLQNTGSTPKEEELKLIASGLKDTLTNDKADEVLSSPEFVEIFANYEVYKLRFVVVLMAHYNSSGYYTQIFSGIF